jgi:hypothetical protein
LGYFQRQHEVIHGRERIRKEPSRKETDRERKKLDKKTQAEEEGLVSGREISRS